MGRGLRPPPGENEGQDGKKKQQNVAERERKRERERRATCRQTSIKPLPKVPAALQEMKYL